MAANPNPARIHDETWHFWEAFAAYEPKVRLGGIYAFKPGYHSSRDENAKNWPGNYSIRDPQDQAGPADKAAAIDLTFPDAQAGNYATIDRYSSRLLASGQDPADPRGDFLKEFFGQADTDTGVEGWDFRYLRTTTSDSSHLWHVHISISREHVGNPETYRALLSILKGETVAQWRAGTTEEDDVIYARTTSNATVWVSNGVERRPVSRLDSIIGGEAAIQFVADDAALTDMCGPPYKAPLTATETRKIVAEELAKRPNATVDVPALAAELVPLLPTPATPEQIADEFSDRLAQ